MIFSGRYRLASEDIAGEAFDDEYVLLNLANGFYFSATGPAHVFLQGILSGFEVAEMLNAVAGGRLDEARRFLSDLHANALIEKNPEASAERVPADWIERLQASGGPIVLEVFGDLADLIIADPIHDTDEEKGWPVLRGE